MEFVSVGEYPDYQDLDVNLPECGFNSIPIIYEIHFPSNCIRNQIKNKTVFGFDTNRNTLRQNTSERIFLGQNTKYGESPWTVLVKISHGVCTGVLITFQWVLTTAHCYNAKYMSLDILFN